MKKSLSVVAVFFSVLIISSIFYPKRIQSANLTIVKDTIQSSRLSFAGRVKSPTAAGTSHVWIYTVAATGFNSISTAGLKVDDSVVIGGTNSYIVASIIDEDEFTTTTNLAAGDADDTDTIYFKARPRHVVTFNTATAIANGFFRVLIPAATTNFNDSIPDSTGFDFNSTVDIIAANSGSYTFSNNAATVSGGTGCSSPTNYHCFEFHYSGPGAISTPIQLTIGNTNGINTPIAPAPSSTHTQAKADTYQVIVQNFSAGANPAQDSPVDETTARIGIIESVRVKAVVPPYISATPPLGQSFIITPTTPAFPTVPPVVTRPPAVLTTIDLFYLFLLILIILGLLLHLVMAIIGAGTPLNFIPKFLWILAFPFLRRKKYQTVPFAYIDFYISDKLDKPWQSVVSDIKGFYNLKSPIPPNLFIHLTAIDHTWKDTLFKGALIPITCLYPLLVRPAESKRLNRVLFDGRIIPLIIALLSSTTALIIKPSYETLSYIFLASLYLFSEYLYPKL